MRSEFQVDGATGSLFVVSKTLMHGYPNLDRYEELVRIRGVDLRAGCGRIVVYAFEGDDNRCALYLSTTPFLAGEVAAVTAVAYDPETPDDMLEEFMDATDLMDTDAVPFGFFDVYDDTFRLLLKQKIEMVEGKI